MGVTWQCATKVFKDAWIKGLSIRAICRSATVRFRDYTCAIMQKQTI